MARAFLYRLSCLMAALLLCCCTASAQDMMDKIEQALKMGNANALSAYFDEHIGITLNNKDAAYSDKQGLQVLRDFFKKNPVTEFSIKHVGNQASRAGFYALGTMLTKNGEYKVYLYIKHLNKQSYLAQIQIKK